MSNMSRLSLAIEETCALCNELKCEGCKMKIDIGDKIVYVNGKTKEILGSEKKSDLAKTGAFILSCMRACLVLCLLTGSAVASEIVDVGRLADAIYLAEGGAKTSHPYGILQHYKHTTARQACVNTINHALRDYSGHGDFIEFLGSRYCPIGCDNDNGTNRYWVKNVKYFYNR